MHREPRSRLAAARLMLLFTPELVRRSDPLAVLASVLPHVDVVQVRPKPLADASAVPGEARATLELARAVLALLPSLGDEAPLVTVNDRVDVAALLLAEGLAGVHLGQEDTPPREARRLLGETALIGLSTHTAEEVAQAQVEPIDYLGFGPVFATPTKGYSRGLGPERAWLASQASSLPLFALGGIHASNLQELAEVGRVAVGSAILSAPDPARAARDLRGMLS
jgi:thiamine-phosphate pyrophosphorylase